MRNVAVDKSFLEMWTPEVIYPEDAQLRHFIHLLAFCSHF